jgi:hypothetical protein
MILRCYLPPINDKARRFDWGSCDNENGVDALTAKIAAFRDVSFWRFSDTTPLCCLTVRLGKNNCFA